MKRLPALLGRVPRALRGVPGFVRLLWRLMRDRRVSALDRTLFGLAIAYLLVPFDLVPDWIPVLGEMDDLLLVLLALDRLLYRTDGELLLEHWDGDPAALGALRELVDGGTEVLPRWARGLLRAG